MKSIKYYLFFVCIVSNSNIMKSQEFGLQLYSLRNQFKINIENSIKTISDWGIKVVEGGDSYGMIDSEFIKLLNKYEIEIVSIGASFEDLRDNIDKVLAETKKYNVKYVMCAWIPHEGVFSIKDAKSAVNVFNNAGKVLSDNGVILTYHIHGYEFHKYQSKTLFDFIVNNSENFFFQMDVYWVKHGGEDPLDLLNRYPNKFVMMHLKDMKKGVLGDKSGHQDVETNVVLGQGQIDIEGVVKKGKELGIRYMFIEDESSRVLKQIPLSLDFLKSIK